MNPSTALATVLVDELVRGGVTEAVLSPGSRSAPLAFALHRADADGRLRLHVRIDERTAGFLALGLAKASGRPVPVVTTSGTAAVNLHPAVVEARTRACRCSRSPPTGRPSCAASAPTRPSTRCGCTATSVRCSSTCRRPTTGSARSGSGVHVAGQALGGAAATGRCTSTCRCASRSCRTAPPPWVEPLDAER